MRFRTGDGSVFSFLLTSAVVTDPETKETVAVAFFIPDNFVLGEQ